MSPLLGILDSAKYGPLHPPYNFYSIATITAAGGESSVTFSSIPQTYKSLQLRIICRDTASTDQTSYNSACQIYFNGTVASAPNHILYGNGTSVAAISNGPYSTFILAGAYLPSTATNTFAPGIVDIIDYANTNKYKTVKIIAGSENNASSTNRSIALSSALWPTTTAINSITIQGGNSAHAAGSTFALYGIS